MWILNRLKCSRATARLPSLLIKPWSRWMQGSFPKGWSHTTATAHAALSPMCCGRRRISSGRKTEHLFLGRRALDISPSTQVTFKGLDSMVEYMFASRTMHRGFSNIYGVAVRERFKFDWPGETVLNLRTMNGLDLVALEIYKANNKNMLPLYEV
ncbi:hypothetical protein B0H17DRAFT_1333795 [Mycena rosella]|uniref:Uncharacterized protein n=1 Tax=Mycena rosella TaxID=1033263 RepID=A0AAD7D6B9_MYCRO|nr:hypothetical protein B0H17DRAFT_1333795 [Mycena rosella]